MIIKFFAAALCAVLACLKTLPAYTQASSVVLKNELIKIKWIEGGWKGMDGASPFYEIYSFINDTTLKITSYEWNGKDSSKSSYDYVRWLGNGYYLGKNQNWKVTGISKEEIKMLPVKASNDIIWRYKDKVNWEAVLTSNGKTIVYNMQRFEPFKNN